jgi:hypothetical protein
MAGTMIFVRPAAASGDSLQSKICTKWRGYGIRAICIYILYRMAKNK